jgi:nicotinate-nucleotide adenylyltransferase
VRIGLFGGTFNPIHTAHLVLAEQARDVLGLKQVIFVPAKVPPHKRNHTLARPEHRMEMARLAIQGNRRFTLSDIEVKRSGPSYSVDTVEAMRRRFGARCELLFLIGSDTIPELPKWHRIDELLDRCVIVPLTRPGVDVPPVEKLATELGAHQARGILDRMIEMPLIGISATAVRRRVDEGRSVRYLVPDSVADYIAEKGLYKGSRADEADTSAPIP